MTMIIVLAFSFSAIAAATPLIRTQSGSLQSIEPLDQTSADFKNPGSQQVSFDASGHAALSQLIPPVSPMEAESTLAELTVFIKANSGLNLYRERGGKPLTNVDGGADPTDQLPIWKDSKEYSAQWTMHGSNDGSGVFIKAADLYLVDTGEGHVAVRREHTGPWKLGTSSDTGRITITSAQGNLLKEDEAAQALNGTGVVLASHAEDDVTMFEIFLKDVAWRLPANSTLAPNEEVQEGGTDDPHYEDSGDTLGLLQAARGGDRTNKITAFIIGKENGGHLRENSHDALDLDGAWDADSQWVIADADDKDGRVFIMSKSGAYLRDNQGTLDLGTIDDGGDVTDKMWLLEYGGEHGMMSLQSTRLRYMETTGDDDNIIQMSQGDPEEPLHNPGPTENNFFTIQMISARLF